MLKGDWPREHMEPEWTRHKINNTRCQVAIRFWNEYDIVLKLVHLQVSVLRFNLSYYCVTALPGKKKIINSAQLGNQPGTKDDLILSASQFSCVALMPIKLDREKSILLPSVHVLQRPADRQTVVAQMDLQTTSLSPTNSDCWYMSTERSMSWNVTVVAYGQGRESWFPFWWVV